MYEDNTTNMTDKAMNCNETRETSKELNEKLTTLFCPRGRPTNTYRCCFYTPHNFQFRVKDKSPSRSDYKDYITKAYHVENISNRNLDLRLTLDWF